MLAEACTSCSDHSELIGSNYDRVSGCSAERFEIANTYGVLAGLPDLGSRRAGTHRYSWNGPQVESPFFTRKQLLARE